MNQYMAYAQLTAHMSLLQAESLTDILAEMARGMYPSADVNTPLRGVPDSWRNPFRENTHCDALVRALIRADVEMAASARAVARDAQPSSSAEGRSRSPTYTAGDGNGAGSSDPPPPAPAPSSRVYSWRRR